MTTVQTLRTARPAAPLLARGAYCYDGASGSLQFSWRSVAASAVGAGVGQAVGGAMNSTFGEGTFGARLATGLVAGTAAAVARGGKVAVQQVAIDAFSNVVGQSLVEASTPTTQGFGPSSGVDHVNGMDLQSDQAYAQRLRNEVYGFAGVSTGSGLGLRDGGGAGLSFAGVRAPEPIDPQVNIAAGPPRPGMKFTDDGWQEIGGSDPGAINQPTADAGKWAKDQWQGMRQGWNREGWSVLQGERPVGYALGSGTRALVGGLTGADSLANARAAWNKGDYVRAPLYGMQAVGEAGLTALTLGEYQLMKMSAGMLVSERMAVSMFPGPEATVAARATYRTVPVAFEPGVEFAMVNGIKVEPQRFGAVYYGTDNRTLGLSGSMSADDVAQHLFQNGLPARGTNIDLIDHAIHNARDRAFRGTTIQPISQERNAGAVYWASEGGVVIEMKNVRGYEVNAALEGRVPRPGGFGGNTMKAELEVAVPGAIRPEQITRVGVPRFSDRGQPTITWIERRGQ